MKNQTWGGRFQKELNPIVQKFNASISFDHKLYEFDILGSIAHAKMLAKQNLITEQECFQICNGLLEIKKEIRENLLSFDETCEDIHMFIEQHLIKKIGAAGKKLHTGRSRNDQVALDLRLFARESSLETKQLLEKFISSLDELTLKHDKDTMPGYTHLQQAQPIYLGQYFNAYCHMFKRDLQRLNEWYNRMNYCPLGAGALAGSELPLDRNWVANYLKFSNIIENTIDAVSDRDYVIEFCSIASIIMMHLSRLSEDLILWATQEFNFLTLDDAFATGSSLMPNKKNPDVLELIRGKCGRVYGNLMAILTTMKGLPLSYNKDLQEDKEILFDTFNTLNSCLEVITPFLKSCSFNCEAMKHSAKKGFLDATQLVEKLVLQGVPFREAHHQVGQMVALAIERGCVLKDLEQ